MELTRRQILMGLPFGGSLLVLEGCPGLSQGGADSIVGFLDAATVAAQAILPILSVALPPPYNLAIPSLEGFLNIGNSLAGGFIEELASTDPAATQAQKLISLVASTVLDPQILAKLPATVNGVSLSQEIPAYEKALNDAIGAFTHMVPGATVVPPTPANALVGISVPAATAHILATAQSPTMKMNTDSLKKMIQIQGKLAKMNVGLKGSEAQRKAYTMRGFNQDEALLQEWQSLPRVRQEWLKLEARG